MKPITHLEATEARALEGVLFDLDDTVLDAGKLTEAAYGSLFRLREAGLLLIAVTGRPATWAELVARQWPVHAALAENGPLAFFEEDERLHRLDSASLELRSERAARLAALVETLRRELPELRPADDVNGRVTDYAFDVNEHHRADEAVIARAIELGHGAGASSFRSSIHLHFTFDRHDKASGALHFLRTRYGMDPTRARRTFAFVGDSENDAPGFAAFRTTIGVANLRGRPSLLPRFVTGSARGAGFAEAAQRIVALRSAS